MKIKNSFVKKIAYLYFTLPVICFFVGYLKPYIGIPAAVLLSAALFFCLKKDGDDDKSVILSKKTLFAVLFAALLWCFFAGHGGFFYQNPDQHNRNAIFRDMITLGWPVKYTAYNRALTYYIAQWMLPAAGGRVLYMLGASVEMAFNVANILLFIYNALGISIVFLMLIVNVKADNGKKIAAALFIIVFFSGLDIIGCFIFNQPITEHIEWWATEYQSSSLSTCLFWVYNQTIVPWVMTLCFMSEKKVKIYAFTAVMCLLYGPYPALGLAIYMVFAGILRLIDKIKTKEVKGYIKEIFSFQNIIAVLVAAPILILYYASNSAVNVPQQAGSGFIRLYTTDTKNVNYIYELWRWFSFVLLEGGLYALVIARKNKADKLFWLTVFMLSVLPLFRIGPESDFSMRTTIPVTFTLAVYVIKYVVDNMQNKDVGLKKPIKKVALFVLIALLIIGAVTPCFEFARGIKAVAEAGHMGLIADDYYTCNLYDFPNRRNFVTENASESFFYKYLAQ